MAMTFRSDPKALRRLVPASLIPNAEGWVNVLAAKLQLKKPKYGYKEVGIAIPVFADGLPKGTIPLGKDANALFYPRMLVDSEHASTLIAGRDMGLRKTNAHIYTLTEKNRIAKTSMVTVKVTKGNELLMEAAAEFPQDISTLPPPPPKAAGRFKVALMGRRKIPDGQGGSVIDQITGMPFEMQFKGMQPGDPKLASLRFHDTPGNPLKTLIPVEEIVKVDFREWDGTLPAAFVYKDLLK
jgi:hypothetical protein